MQSSIQGQYAHSGALTARAKRDEAARPCTGTMPRGGRASSRSHHNTLNAEARTPPLAKSFALSRYDGEVVKWTGGFRDQVRGYARDKRQSPFS
jgi:hypothetical protein